MSMDFELKKNNIEDLNKAFLFQRALYNAVDDNQLKQRQRISNIYHQCGKFIHDFEVPLQSLVAAIKQTHPESNNWQTAIEPIELEYFNFKTKYGTYWNDGNEEAGWDSYTIRHQAEKRMVSNAAFHLKNKELNLDLLLDYIEVGQNDPEPTLQEATEYFKKLDIKLFGKDGSLNPKKDNRNIQTCNDEILFRPCYFDRDRKPFSGYESAVICRALGVRAQHHDDNKYWFKGGHNRYFPKTEQEIETERQQVSELYSSLDLCDRLSKPVYLRNGLKSNDLKETNSTLY